VSNGCADESNIFSRAVVDRTGLTGMFDVETSPSSPDASSRAAATPARIDETLMLKAVHDQPGLDLLLEQTSAQVLVIDHVEHLADR
jgi:uncharacterized protein (TIGR03435 family)